MKKPTWSRRDVLKGIVRGCGGGALVTPAKVLAAAPPATAITPQLIEAAKKEGKVDLLHLDRPADRRADRQGLRGEVPRHCGAGRAHRRRARVPAHRPGIWSRIYAVDVVNSSDAAHFIVWKREGILEPFVPEDVAKHYKPEHKDADGHVRGVPRRSVRHRLQHQPGEEGGRAEELRRPARSEMGRQDGQGASRLQRHDHDRDPADGARPRLGVLREARQAARSCRCSRQPIRPRSSISASAPSWPTATSTTCSRSRPRTAPVEIVHPTEGTPFVVGPNGIFKRAPNPNAARLFQLLLLHAGVPAAHRRCRQAALTASADQGDRRSAGRSASSRP